MDFNLIGKRTYKNVHVHASFNIVCKLLLQQVMIPVPVKISSVEEGGE